MGVEAVVLRVGMDARVLMRTCLSMVHVCTCIYIFVCVRTCVVCVRVCINMITPISHTCVVVYRCRAPRRNKGHHQPYPCPHQQCSDPQLILTLVLPSPRPRKGSGTTCVVVPFSRRRLTAGLCMARWKPFSPPNASLTPGEG